ncbi:uncharacterized protein LOC109423511 isoform X2 [Aedes albopictus]
MPYRKKRFDPLSDEVVQSLLLYFTSASRVVDRLITQNDIVVAAWYDTAGDYLHSYLYPVTKYCFYSGNVSYSSVKTVQEYYKQVKLRLDTDGYGWSHPNLDTSGIRSSVQVLKTYQNFTKCTELDYNSSMEIPLPKLEIDDDSQEAISLWVPLKSRQVYDPRTKGSLSVLRIYVETVLQCASSGIQTNQFATQFIQWIEANLTKCLMDAAFYPGLESILRIKRTLETEVAIKSVRKKSILQDENESSSGLMRLVDSLLGSDEPAEAGSNDQDETTEDERRWTRIKLLTATVFFAIFFLVLCVVISVKLRMNRKAMKRKAAVKKEHFKPWERRKYPKGRGDRSDEEVLLMMEKRNASETSESGWRHVRPKLLRQDRAEPQPKPSTSRQIPPFSDTEEDEFIPFQPKQFSSEKVPLIAKSSPKKKGRCGRGCLCMSCIRKPKNGHEVQDLQNSSAYKLASKKADQKAGPTKTDQPVTINSKPSLGKI